MGHRGARPRPNRSPNGRSGVAGGGASIASSCRCCGRAPNATAPSATVLSAGQVCTREDQPGFCWGWSSFALMLKPSENMYMLACDIPSFDEFSAAVSREPALVVVYGYCGGAFRKLSLLSALDLERELWVGNRQWMAAVKRTRNVSKVQLLRSKRGPDRLKHWRRQAIAV